MEQQEIEIVKNQFDKVLLETVWTDNGEPSYVIKDGFDVVKYADIAKQLLEAEKLIAHDFTSSVTNQSGSATVNFDYKSGWFLEGLSGGELE